MTTPHDAPRPTAPAGAYDTLLADVLPKAREQRIWEPSDGRLPTVFVSHEKYELIDGYVAILNREAGVARAAISYRSSGFAMTGIRESFRLGVPAPASSDATGVGEIAPATRAGSPQRSR